MKERGHPDGWRKYECNDCDRAGGRKEDGVEGRRQGRRREDCIQKGRGRGGKEEGGWRVYTEGERTGGIPMVEDRG